MIPVSQPSMGDDERRWVDRCFQTNQITYGPGVRLFESKLGEYLKVGHVICTSSGTTALHLALAALGIGPGDEVLVPDLTYVATANAVKYCGAKVVLVDIDPKTWCMDLDEARRKINENTKAIIPVHLYGMACDMTEILRMAQAHGLLIVEDAAEGFTHTHAGRQLGTFGAAGVFSFYGNKILTTGEGGAVATDSEALAKRLYHLRGQAMDPDRRFFHNDVGFNYRMTDLQASVGIGQMKHLDEMISARNEIFMHYWECLKDYGTAPSFSFDVAPWLFTFIPTSTGKTREQLMQALAEAGIETRPAFVPLHRMPMYRGHDEDFPVACSVGDAGLSLPTYADLTEMQVDYICTTLVKALGGFNVR